MNPREPVVFLVDDDEAVRDAVSLSLAQEGISVKAYESAQSFLQDYQPEQPGCLLLDLRMQEMDGIELQRQLKDKQSKIPIIYVSGHGDVSSSVLAMKLGAMDFLEKPVPKRLLLNRIQTAFAEDAQRREQEKTQSETLTKYSQLTERERQVMSEVVQGLTNKEIAKKLDISFRTVEKYRAAVMRKMGAQNLAELVHLVETSGILPGESEERMDTAEQHHPS